MNNTSPLVPQGSMLEQKNKGRARVKIAVFVVLAVHGIGLLALLMQGCKKEAETSNNTADQASTNAPAFVDNTNAPSLADTNAPATNTPAPPAVVEQTPPSSPPTPPPTAVPDYKVVAGDTLSGIAKKFHVSTRALQDANPGVEATKLKIGQTLHIPSSTMATAAPAGSTLSVAAPTPGGEQVYSVKSGDTLTKIASEFKVSVRSIRSANSLTTDKIRVGQKLKIPTKASTPALTSAPPTTPTDTAPVPPATAAPSSPSTNL